MSLADQIIEHGPYGAYQIVPNAVMRYIESDQLNELRDELTAARALKELLASGRFTVYSVAVPTEIGLTWLTCKRCPEWSAEYDEPATLAELVQRATQHTEVCIEQDITTFRDAGRGVRVYLRPDGSRREEPWNR